MTPELHNRWQASLRPFDGLIIVDRNDLDLITFHQMLIVAIVTLRPHATGLQWYLDWHEHDGVVLENAEDVTWDAISESVRSTEALSDLQYSDCYVRIGIFPPTFEWLLRYNIDDADSGLWPDAVCNLDFCCTPDSPTSELIDTLARRWPNLLEVMPAKKYFDDFHVAGDCRPGE